MTWTYEQATGRLLRPDGTLAGEGYSGAPEWKNQPSGESLKNQGPIPQGKYTVANPIDTVTHGPFVLSLTPDADNEMFSRDGFLIHGDSVVNPGTASNGCIILARSIREEIATSRDRELEVTAGVRV